jgi:thymidylate synthase
MRSYQTLLRDILNNGENHDDRTGVGTLSLCGYQFRHSMSEGFPLLTTKRIPLRWVAEELFWFLSGDTDERNLRARGVDIWKEWATEEQCAKFNRLEGDLGPVYGWLWRNFGAKKYDLYWRERIEKDEEDYQGIDQIRRLLDDIKFQPNSRRLLVSGWDPNWSNHVALPPCHTVWQIKIHEKSHQMSLHLYARSIDSFLGLPFNIASYGLLLTLIAHVTGYTPRDLSRAARELPTLLIHPIVGSEANSALEALLSIRWEHLKLMNYNPHPKIEADVAI